MWKAVYPTNFQYLVFSPTIILIFLPLLLHSLLSFLPTPLSAPEALSLQDSELITGLLETMVVLWEGAREQLDKRTNRAIHNKLVGRVAETLPLLFDTFKVHTCIT